MGLVLGEINLVFDADDRRIAGRDNEWVKDALALTKGTCRDMGAGDERRKIQGNGVYACFHLGGGGGVRI